MADPIKLQILKKLTTLLEGVTAPNGTVLTGCVFRGRNKFDQANDPANMLSLLESPRPDVPSTAGEFGSHSSYEWVILLQGWTPDDKANPSDNAYIFMDAVEQQLARVKAVRTATGNPVYPSDFMLGNLITSFAFGPGVVRPPDELSSRAYFYLPVKLGMTSVVG